MKVFKREEHLIGQILPKNSHVQKENRPPMNKLLFDNDTLVTRQILRVSILSGNRYEQIIIDKIDDEWYTAIVIMMKTGSERFYRCDQLDGLIQFIKDSLSNRIK